MKKQRNEVSLLDRSIIKFLFNFSVLKLKESKRIVIFINIYYYLTIKYFLLNIFINKFNKSKFLKNIK